MRSISWRWAALLLPLAIAANFAASLAPAVVETHYARGLYPRILAAVSAITGALPTAIAEPIAVAIGLLAAALLLRAIVRFRRLPDRRAWLLEALLRSLAVAGILYGTFLLLWGFNYRRPAFAALAGLDAHPAPLAELQELTSALIEDANALRAPLEETHEGVFRLKRGLRDTLARASAGLSAAARAYPALAAVDLRPKPAWLSPLFSRVGISGIFIPFTAEPLVNAALPEAELPFSASHELAHGRGLAREDEANFVAYVACRLHPDADFRYSGALVASFYAAAALASADRKDAERLLGHRSPAVERDVAAIRAWAARYEGPLQRVGERVNDAYLKSQGQAEGVHSYGRMLDLLLAERRSPSRVLGSAR
jgi:hypothetical protein